MSATLVVWSLWYGMEIAGRMRLELLSDGIRLVGTETNEELSVPYEVLEGLRRGEGHLTLYAAHGDVIELSGDGLDGLADAIAARTCIVPELTLALRGLGSARAHRGADHDRFFAPFLSARRAAQRATDAATRLGALHAAALAAELDRVLHEFSMERFPSSAPDRRALETQLEDLAAPVRASLVSLDTAAKLAADAGGDTAFVAWRAWAAQCRVVFHEADRCWLQAVSVLEATPVVNSKSWWRRSLRRSGSTDRIRDR